MKIAHIVESSATGTLSMVSLLSNGQAVAGHTVHVIYSIRPETPKNLASLFHAGVKIINVNMAGLAAKGSSLFMLRRLLLNLAPDVVFMHSSFAGFLGRAASFGILPSARFFYVPHCISFMRTDIGSMKRRIFVALERLAALRKCEYIACSESELKAIQAQVRFRPSRLIENAVEFDTSLNLGDTWPRGRRSVVVTVGQIRAQKGPPQFAAIAREVLQRHPDVEFVWIGDGDAQMRRELEEAGVQVTGWMAKIDVLHYLADCLLYLSTSRWEGMPVSVIEAHAANLPVVASACAGNVDVIKHGETGWLFDDTAGAVRCIDDLLISPHIGEAAVVNARNAITKRFSAQRYLGAFADLVESR
jgi:glycosyltransferase involved in cell wall biosynthesis